jgi:hypothetical protein
MKKTEFDRKKQLLYKITYNPGLDEMEKHNVLLRAAAFALGIKWYHVIPVKLDIKKTVGTLIFDKLNQYKTDKGSPITLYSFYSGNTHEPKGNEYPGKVIEIVKNHNGDVVVADCRSSYHDLMCARFHETIPIEHEQN